MDGSLAASSERWRLPYFVWLQLFLVFFISKKLLKKNIIVAFILCVALIFAGALGNLIDSMFYGMIFQSSSLMLFNVAKIFPAHGYAGFLHGNVVDMLYFPIIHTQFPTWFPFWGGQHFDFFSPIFNLADASISPASLLSLFFKKDFFKATSSNMSQHSEKEIVVKKMNRDFLKRFFKFKSYLMKFGLKLSFYILVVTVLFNSCKKEYSSEHLLDPIGSWEFRRGKFIFRLFQIIFRPLRELAPM